MCFRALSSNGVLFPSGRNFWSGSRLKVVLMVSSGLKPQKASKSVSASAISGLWFGSVNWDGSSLCSFAAISLFWVVGGQ